MAKAARRTARSGGNEASWKKSKSVAAALGVSIVGLWIYMLSGSSQPDIPKIPQAYWDTDKAALFVSIEPFSGFPPYAHPDSKAKTLWEAWTCTNPSCATKNNGKPPVFPKIIKLPKGVEAPVEGSDTPPDFAFEQAFMEAEMSMPKCPVCKKEEFSTRFITDEAQKIIADIQAQYAEKNKKNKK